MMRGRYGATPARFYWEGERDSLAVHLERDPGSGSLLFPRISPACVAILEGDADDIRRAGRYLRDGARYITPGSPVIARYLTESDRLEQLAGELERVTR